MAVFLPQTEVHRKNEQFVDVGCVLEVLSACHTARELKRNCEGPVELLGNLVAFLSMDFDFRVAW